MLQDSLVDTTGLGSGLVDRVRLSFALLGVLAVGTLCAYIPMSPHLIRANVRRCPMVFPIEHSHLITFESEL